MSEQKSNCLCADHDKNTAAINRHAGMWRILLAFGGTLLVFCGFQYNAVRGIETASVKMDKTFTAYIAANAKEIGEIRREIQRCYEAGLDREKRIRVLEINHNKP